MKIWKHEIVGRESGPHLLITAGVHGDEFEPMQSVRRLIGELHADELCGKVTLVPVVNEPAFRRGHRTADDGLDLARTCPGRPDGTVTEQVASELSKLIRGADYYIDLHTGGTRLTVLPLTGYMLHPKARVLDEQRRMARAFGLPLIWGTDPNLNGRSLSVARDANVPAIYAEYLGGGRCDPSGIEAYVHGCCSVMRELGIRSTPTTPGGMNARRDANLPGGLPTVYEDSRPGAGHMQVNHPTANEGFFTPHVKLGQSVKAGEVLGTVCDVSGEQVETICSRYTGIVIVLHTFPRVDQGTSVAVVLDTQDG